MPIGVSSSFTAGASLTTGPLERMIIALNFSSFDQAVDVPFSVPGRWGELLDGADVDISGLVAPGRPSALQLGSRIHAHVVALNGAHQARAIQANQAAHGTLCAETSQVGEGCSSSAQRVCYRRRCLQK
jgi:hypothetical protein